MATKRASKAANIAQVAQASQASWVSQANEGERPEKLQKLLLTFDEAAELAGGINPRTLQRERKRGRIQAVNLGRRVFVPYWELQRYVRMLCDEQGIVFDDAALAG